MGVADRAVIIGIDAASPELTRFYMERGVLPNISRLAESGVWMDRCLAPYPTLTPPNWTTIATGAWPGTHGITNFHLHTPGEALSSLYSGFNSKENSAEYLWQTAERVGKRSLLIKWPASWPPTITNGVQIDGCHISPCIHRLAPPSFHATEPYPRGTLVETVPASGWETAPESALPPLEAPIALNTGASGTWDSSERPTLILYALLTGDAEGGYDRAIICRHRSVESALVTLNRGEWSGWISLEFPTPSGEKKGYFRLKLQTLSADGSQFGLICTDVTPASGFTWPEDAAAELAREISPFPIDTGWAATGASWMNPLEAVPLTDYQHQWYADVAEYYMQHEGWDLCFVQSHAMDCIQHRCLSEVDPVNAIEPATRQMCEQALRDTFASVDRMVGRLMEIAGEHAVFVLVSDHGSTAGSYPRPKVNRILEEAGLLTYEQGGHGRRRVDWSRTKAYQQRKGYIYVNLRGRDPGGIVEPGREYEAVRRDVIDALATHIDPTSGHRSFSLVLRREDAVILGQWGERIGDIVYAISDGADSNHGDKLPTSSYGMSSMKCLFAMSGPGLRQGVRLERPTWLTDVAPTLASLLGLPVPRDAEGRVIYQALEEPDRLLEQSRELREERDRWRQAYEMQVRMTHIE